MSNNSNLSRREFIRISGMTGAVFVLGYAASCIGKKNSSLVNLSELDLATAREFSPFIMIDANGTVALNAFKPEIGQGTYQSMPLILAEELGVTLEQVHIRIPVANAKFGNMSVGGSESVRLSWTMLRKAGAAAREMLVRAAATRWGVPEQECTTENGMVIHAGSGRKAGFGELIEAAAKLEVPKEPKLKDPASFTLIGKEGRRPDIPQKVDGTARFGLDIKLEGMLYASVERCPVFGGKVKSFDDSEAKKVPGVRQVLVAERSLGKNTYYGVAVVADNLYSAGKGRKALKIEWDLTGIEPESTEKLSKQFRKLSATEGVRAVDKGNVDQAFRSATRTLEAEYDLPFAAHAPMEPQNTVAHVTENKCTVWTPTQIPDGLIGALSRFLKMPETSIEVNYTLVGGGFGRRLFEDFTTEAAFLSRAVKAPVKVVWTREDDMTVGPFRPGTFSTLRAVLDSDGNLTALQHKVVAPSISDCIFGSADPKHREDTGALEGIADSCYEVPNFRANNIFAETNIPLGWWRAVYSATTAYAHECFIDECAHAAGKDPVEFRLSMIKENTRMRKLVTNLREKSRWDDPLPEGWAKGFAVWQFFAGQAGHVVFVSKQEKGVRIEKVVTVIDCGLTVNPDNVRAQMEGGTIMGLSAAIKDEITFENGRTVQTNYHNYRMLRMAEAPVVEVHICPGADVPGGVGEPGLPPVAPALGNAIFALTGNRHRKLPINLEEA